MKKILAVLLATIMMFSVALIPVSAADASSAETEVTIDFEKIETDLATLFETVIKIIKAVHELVGGIMGVLEKECALCGELHVIAGTETAVAF